MKHLRYKRLLALILLVNTWHADAQNREEAMETIADLCSDDMAGRGYINQGDKKAANYITSEFEKIGLKPLSPKYQQSFTLDVNTFPDTEIVVDGKELTPGIDYLVSTTSPSVNLESKPIFLVSKRMLTSKKLGKKVKTALKKGFQPVFETYNAKDKLIAANIKAMHKCTKDATLVFLKDHLTWSVGTSQTKSCEIYLLDSTFNKFSSEFTRIKIDAQLVKDYTSQNVMGYVEGTEYPDSFIIFCGHYDHLGKMGAATFYGANDNASGIAMLLDMAQYFASNPQKYSIAFIGFGAEEAGLLGSLHYVKNAPNLAPLNATKFVFNMDLMGSGENGATIVNGSVYPKYFSKLVDINSQNEYLPQIKKRGKAANSDHYFFSELGIPSFFIYLMGDYTYYHIPQDNANNLELGPYYDASYKLIRDFITEIAN